MGQTPAEGSGSLVVGVEDRRLGECSGMSPESDYAKGMPPRTRTKVVVAAFTVLSVTPFVIAATKATFWQHQHSVAPVATALYLLVLAALVVGRFRWAWYVLAFFIGSVIVGWGFDSNRFAASHVLGFAGALAAFAFLVSPAMRHRLRRPMWGRSRSAHVTRA